ncbi:hypothetical protein L596_010394 [Steinernema carpocapsae]|uniref:W02B3.4-like N-terminal domain-containing protein n=1 Tax=Steinernema carpocapsae TaxID=34508 RepID=A0A4U5PIP2_STECR|nr:hypothetical protein L596_010394 [Steinernema carpocapsae]
MLSLATSPKIGAWRKPHLNLTRMKPNYRYYLKVCWVVLMSISLLIILHQLLLKKYNNSPAILPILIDPTILRCIDCPILKGQNVHFASAEEFHFSLNVNVVFYRIDRNPSNDFWVFEHNGEKRAVKRFSTQVADFKGYKVRIPDDPKRFLWEWNRGHLLTCANITMDRKSQNRVIPLSFVHEMASLRDQFVDHNVTLLMFGGTLLGWYRECSFIPHTTDVDFAVLIEEHSDTLNAELTNSKTFRFYWQLGKVDDSYEYSLYRKSRKIDVFYIYILTAGIRLCLTTAALS